MILCVKCGDIRPAFSHYSTCKPCLTAEAASKRSLIDSVRRIVLGEIPGGAR